MSHLPSSPQSPLSECSSSALSPPHDMAPHGHKRTASAAFRDDTKPARPTADDDDEDDASDAGGGGHISPMEDEISSDTSGSVPGTPHDEEEPMEQVSVCRWEGCGKDQGNMDNLVAHISDEHIRKIKKKHSCEWDDCPRKGMAHASGYALRAHMRSHTREKPFFCSLPECDRSFTRSDALAKHMRTVHETEALRPSDPIPKSHPNHPHNTSLHGYEAIIHSRRISPTPSATLSNEEDEDEDEEMEEKENGVGGADGQQQSALRSKKAPLPEALEIWNPEDGFDREEVTMQPAELYKLLQKKLKWAELRKTELEEEKKGLEGKRRAGWIKKELLVEKLMDMELGEDAKMLISPDPPENEKA